MLLRRLPPYPTVSSPLPYSHDQVLSECIKPVTALTKPQTTPLARVRLPFPCSVCRLEAWDARVRQRGNRRQGVCRAGAPPIRPRPCCDSMQVNVARSRRSWSAWRACVLLSNPVRSVNLRVSAPVCCIASDVCFFWLYFPCVFFVSCKQGELPRGGPGDHLLLHQTVLPQLCSQGDTRVNMTTGPRCSGRPTACSRAPSWGFWLADKHLY